MDINKIEVDDEWEWYIGQLFSRLIENKNNLDCVVELAPGFKYKIAYALAEINFKGNLFIIDANINVIEYVKQKYKEILPNAEITCICDDFSNAINKLPDKIDLFLANHTIDDMIIGRYISTDNYNRLFDAQQEGEKYLKKWTELVQNEEECQKIINEIYHTFKNFFDKKDVRDVIISQYRSNLFFLGRDKNIEDVVRRCFNKIKALVNYDENKIQKRLEFYPFGDDERYLGGQLLENTQNATNWLAGQPKKDIGEK